MTPESTRLPAPAFVSPPVPATTPPYVIVLPDAAFKVPLLEPRVMPRVVLNVRSLVTTSEPPFNVNWSATAVGVGAAPRFSFAAIDIAP